MEKIVHIQLALKIADGTHYEAAHRYWSATVTIPPTESEYVEWNAIISTLSKQLTHTVMMGEDE